MSGLQAQIGGGHRPDLAGGRGDSAFLVFTHAPALGHLNRFPYTPFIEVDLDEEVGAALLGDRLKKGRAHRRPVAKPLGKRLKSPILFEPRPALELLQQQFSRSLVRALLLIEARQGLEQREVQNSWLPQAFLQRSDGLLGLTTLLPVPSQF